MLLMAVDIGNTNVVIGFIDDGRIAGTYRITTKANHTSDEYGLMITQFLALSGYKPADVDDVIISSVVPKVMHSFRVDNILSRKILFQICFDYLLHDFPPKTL